MKVRLFALCAAIVATPALAEHGVPRDGFPNHAERLIHVLVNRARADPAADLATCTVCAEKACYQPRTPLPWGYDLNRAARFHSANLMMSRAALQHDSPCTLVADIRQRYPPEGSCTGDPACACVGGAVGCRPACTSFNERLTLFGTSPRGENVAQGYQTPQAAFYAWLHEPETDAGCGFRLSNGHRYNILTNGPAIGVGVEGLHYTQDFGTTPEAIVPLVAGAHQGSDYFANWFDPDGGTPTHARVNIDGTCRPMTLERGTGESGTWRATVTATGCRRYAFEFIDTCGVAHRVPARGVYGNGCIFDWADDLLAACTFDVGRTDAGLRAGCPPPSSGAGTGGGSTDPGTKSPPEPARGCGCGTAPLALLTALSMLAALRRRPR